MEERKIIKYNFIAKVWKYFDIFILLFIIFIGLVSVFVGFCLFAVVG